MNKLGKFLSKLFYFKNVCKNFYQDNLNLVGMSPNMMSKNQNLVK